MPPKLSESTAVATINNYLSYVHRWGQAGTYALVEPDGRLYPVKREEVQQSLANRFVLPDEGKPVNAFKYWITAPLRAEYDEVIYDPEGARKDPAKRQYNLWRGLSRKPKRGRCLRILRHLFVVVCKRDYVLFRYLVHWLAHAVQHPGTSPGTVIILKSQIEGSGKSIVGSWMTRVRDH